MYLLTSDRQGIAARLLRWSDRAETADSKRYTLLAGINNKVAALDPLGLIGFAPNDPYALPSSLLKRVDSTYRERKFAVPEFQTGELPPVLQKAARAAMDRWMKDGRSLDTRTVQINTELTCQLVLRGGIAVEPSDYGRYFGGQYLQKIAHPETPRPASKPAKPGVSAKPVVLPALAGRRVLLLPLPEDAATVQQLLQTAKRKGFGEAWFRVSAGDAAQVARLAAAVRVGRKIGMPVGAVVEVLRDYPGTPDINLLGETGAVFTKRKIAQNPSRDYYNWQYPGWNVWDAAAILRGLTPLTNVPQLSALVLQATAAPGHAGVVQGGDGIVLGGHFGYTATERLAFLDKQGVDPVDIAGYSHTLGVSGDLPFFAAGDLDDAVTTFRWERNKAHMARLHADLRAVAPALPLFLNDRASSYTWTNTSWYVRWAQGDRVAVCPVYAGESEHRAAAFAASPEPLLGQKTESGSPGTVAEEIKKTFVAARRFRGAAVDCSYQTPEYIFRLLAGIADAR